jgi:hypothetical protein
MPQDLTSCRSRHRLQRGVAARLTTVDPPPSAFSDFIDHFTQKTPKHARKLNPICTTPAMPIHGYPPISSATGAKPPSFAPRSWTPANGVKSATGNLDKLGGLGVLGGSSSTTAYYPQPPIASSFPLLPAHLHRSGRPPPSPPSFVIRISAFDIHPTLRRSQFEHQETRNRHSYFRRSPPAKLYSESG